MKKRITCPHCQQHYEIDESEIAGFNEMTCNSCNKDFQLAGNVSDVPEPKAETPNDPADNGLVKSWRTIATVLSFVIVLCVLLAILSIALSADAHGGDVEAACFGVSSIAILITAFNFHILKVFSKTMAKMLETQEQTLNAIKKIADK
jgi:predicted Zn finger-like uncharacterized protein